MQDIFIVLVVVLVFVVIWRGPKTIPKIGSMLGRGFKAARDEAKDLRAGSDSKEPPAS